MNKSGKVHQITLTAILAAIIVLLAFTPLGYLRIGLVSITFLTVPVVVGGIVLGPVYGGILGAVFGLTSLAQCFMGDVFGATLLNLNLAATVATCLVPRILIGVIAGVLYRVLCRVRVIKAGAFVLTSIAGSLSNTILFVGMLVVFFRESYFGGTAFWTVFVSFFTFNSVLEIVVCGLLGAALSPVLTRLVAKE